MAYPILRPPKRGICIWQWRKAKWLIKVKVCQGGSHCGRPPREKGKYQGECKVKTCEAKKKKRKK
jgi:hypothetical protein